MAGGEDAKPGAAYTVPPAFSDAGCTWSVYSQAILLSLFLTVLMMNGIEANLEWQRWLWREPLSESRRNTFRRHEDPPGTPSPLQIQCQCPPYKECAVDYKINDAMPEFLNMVGVMKDDELEQYKRELEEAQSKTTEESLIQKYKSRRLNEAGNENECCCSPRTLMMPTFISDKRFDEVVGRLGKDKDNFIKEEGSSQN